jgi:hypothetical protein
MFALAERPACRSRLRRPKTVTAVADDCAGLEATRRRVDSVRESQFLRVSYAIEMEKEMEEKE